METGGAQQGPAPAIALERVWQRGEVLADEIAAVRTRLARVAGRPAGDVEQRAAASICYQGLASRLLSPAVGAALCHGVLAPPAALGWRRTEGRLRLALRADAAAAAGVRIDGGLPRAEAAAAAVAEHIVAGVLVPLAGAVRAQARLAPRLLYGNAASSLAGAVHALAAARPAHAADAFALARLLLERPPLRRLGRFSAQEPGAGGPAFTRATCCLYYRVPGGAMCGDCAIAERIRPA